MRKDFTPEDELLFLALGGSGEIGMNVNLYGCRGKWLMVDLGMSFGANEYPGTELLFADLDFIEERADDLLGIVLTHAHEDHIGAVPYFAAELGVPLYATPFTADLVLRKLEEAGLVDEVELNVVDREHGSIRLGPFEVTYIPLAHSIAEGNAVLIETPFGRVFHTGDWKLDEEPLIGAAGDRGGADADRRRGRARAGVRFDQRVQPDRVGLEGAVYRGLLERGRAPRRQARAGDHFRVERRPPADARPCGAPRPGASCASPAARSTGSSRSRRTTAICKDFPEPVDFDTAMDLPRGEVLILATGGQGEPRAALARIAEDNHPLSLSAGRRGAVLEPADPGQRARHRPGAEHARAARDHDDHRPPEHDPRLGPSGTARTRGDLRLAAAADPRAGARRDPPHAGAGAARARATGIPSAVFQKNGDIVRLAPDAPGKVAEVRAGRLVLDGDIIVPADGDAIVTRRRLARDGLLIIALDGKGGAQVHGIGLPLDEDYEEFVAEAEADVAEALRKLKGKRDPDTVAEAARLAARRAAQRWSGKKPQTKVLQPQG